MRATTETLVARILQPLARSLEEARRHLDLDPVVDDGSATDDVRDPAPPALSPTAPASRAASRSTVAVRPAGNAPALTATGMPAGSAAVTPFPPPVAPRPEPGPDHAAARPGPSIPPSVTTHSATPPDLARTQAAASAQPPVTAGLAPTRAATPPAIAPAPPVAPAAPPAHALPSSARRVTLPPRSDAAPASGIAPPPHQPPADELAPLAVIHRPRPAPAPHPSAAPGAASRPPAHQPGLTALDGDGAPHHAPPAIPRPVASAPHPPHRLRLRLRPPGAAPAEEATPESPPSSRPAPSLLARNPALTHVMRAIDPVLDKAWQVTDAALLPERDAPPRPASAADDTPDTAGAGDGLRVSNHFHVNVALGGDASASAGRDPQQLQDALVALLRDAARRQGLDV